MTISCSESGDLPSVIMRKTSSQQLEEFIDLKLVGSIVIKYTMFPI